MKSAGRNKKGRRTKSAEPKRRNMPVYSGKIIITPGGLGFVTVEGEESEIFIPPQYTGRAMDGDLVEVEILDETRPSSKGPAGKVKKIVERTRKAVVGELLAGRKIRPLNRRLPDVDVSGSLGEARKGEWVELELSQPGKGSSSPRGTLKGVLGKAGGVAADIDAVIREYGLVEPYTEDQNKRASNIVPDEFTRTDMTRLFSITIDPFDAKDFDDAISISPDAEDDGGIVELGVHIADVSAYVMPGSEFDLEARRRGFTAYIPGNTLPMLPASLTENASLMVGRDTPAHSVLFKVDSKSGKVISAKRSFSTVRIAARLTFDEVQSAIDGSPPQQWTPKLAKAVDKLVALTRIMRKYRAKTEHFLELATREIRVVCDDKTKEIKGIVQKTQTEADQLVEECMLAANVAVACELDRRRIPGLYRVHPEPSPEKLQDLTVFLEQTFGISPGDLSSRIACNHFLSNLPDDQNKPVILDAFLRAMMRAYYLERPQLHFGLGKGLYSHFTSPIRRYPDTVVHQQLRLADKGEKLIAQDKIANFAKNCSEQELNIDSAYYAANDRLKLHYVKDKMLDSSASVMEGNIRKVTSSGLNVDIHDLGISGFVHLEDIPGSYRKSSGKFIAQKGHATYKCGDFIYLQLDRIDMIRGMAIFRPVS